MLPHEIVQAPHNPRIWALATALTVVGCGPVQSTALIVDAQAELAAARTARAPEYAPFEFVAAEAYLHKAREEQSYSDFEIAVDYAQKSLDCARVARMHSEAAARAALGTSRPTRATSQRCRPGPDRNLPAPDEEPAASRARVVERPAAKKDPKEPDDPPPAAAPPPANLTDGPVEPPAGDLPDGEPPEGDPPDGDPPDGDGEGDGAEGDDP